MVAVLPTRSPSRPRARKVSFGALRIVSDAEGRQNQRSALRGPASTHTVECPTCETPILRSAVVADDRPQFWPTHQQHAIFHRAYCAHCDAMFAWLEASNASGTRTGEVLGHGMIREPSVVEQFLAANPEAAGVLQG